MRNAARYLSLVICFMLAVGLLSCAASLTPKNTGEDIDDSVITTKVMAKLLADPDVKGLGLEVETFEGVVQLNGFVHSKKQALKAVEIAHGVNGVKSVKNSLIVKRMFCEFTKVSKSNIELSGVRDEFHFKQDNHKKIIVKYF